MSFTVANAQCPEPPEQGAISVPHATCQPPGPPSKGGHDGFACIPTGQQGGSITGICIQGCCKYVSSTSASDAAKAGGASLLGQIGQQLFSKLLEQLMGGGGSGGSGGGGAYQAPVYTTDSDEERLLDIDLDGVTDEDDDLGLGDIIFGNESDDDSDDSEGETTTQTTTNSEDDESDTTQDEEDVVEAVATVGNGTTQNTSVNTQNNDTAIVYDDSSDFDSDYNETSFDTSDGTVRSSGLSLETLEAQGLLEAARLGLIADNKKGSLSVPYESLTPAEIRSLQDYQNSAVSGRLNPFENALYSDDTTDETQKKGILGRVLGFLAALFGISSSDQ